MAQRGGGLMRGSYSRLEATPQRVDFAQRDAPRGPIEFAMLIIENELIPTTLRLNVWAESFEQLVSALARELGIEPPVELHVVQRDGQLALATALSELHAADLAPHVSSQVRLKLQLRGVAVARERPPQEPLDTSVDVSVSSARPASPARAGGGRKRSALSARLSQHMDPAPEAAAPETAAPQHAQVETEEADTDDIGDEADGLLQTQAADSAAAPAALPGQRSLDARANFRMDESVEVTGGQAAGSSGCSTPGCPSPDHLLQANGFCIECNGRLPRTPGPRGDAGALSKQQSKKDNRKQQWGRGSSMKFDDAAMVVAAGALLRTRSKDSVESRQMAEDLRRRLDAFKAEREDDKRSRENFLMKWFIVRTPLLAAIVYLGSVLYGKFLSAEGTAPWETRNTSAMLDETDRELLIVDISRTTAMVANLIYIMGSALLMVVGWNTVELNEWFDQHVGFFWLKAFADVLYGASSSVSHPETWPANIMMYPLACFALVHSERTTYWMVKTDLLAAFGVIYMFNLVLFLPLWASEEWGEEMDRRHGSPGRQLLLAACGLPALVALLHTVYVLRPRADRSRARAFVWAMAVYFTWRCVIVATFGTIGWVHSTGEDTGRLHNPFMLEFGTLHWVVVQSMLPTCAMLFFFYHKELIGRKLRNLVKKEELIAGLMAHGTETADIEDLAQNLRRVRWSKLTKELFEPRKSDGGTIVRHFDLSEECAAHEGEIDFYLSHAWDDDADAKFRQLTLLAQRFEEEHGREPTFWFDRCCAHEDSTLELNCLPLFIHACDRLLILYGVNYDLSLWCATEMYVNFEIASQPKFLLLKLFHGLTPVTDIKRFDVTRTRRWDVPLHAKRPAELKMHSVINARGVADFNAQIRQLVKFLAPEPAESEFATPAKDLTCDKKGWLDKATGQRGFSRRYFVAMEGHMYHFSKDTDTSFVRAIPLRGSTIESVGDTGLRIMYRVRQDDAVRTQSFALSPSPRPQDRPQMQLHKPKSQTRTYMLECETTKNRDRWHETLGELGEEEVDELYYHVFISYRQASEKKLAKRLHDKLTAMQLKDNGQKLRVFLDAEKLRDGENWQSAFMEALANSWVCVPLVSTGSLERMTQLRCEDSGAVTPRDGPDNVLCEWMSALELFTRDKISSILPIRMTEGLRAMQSILPEKEHVPTKAQASSHLRKILAGSSDLESGRRGVLDGAAQTVADASNSPGAVRQQKAITVKGVVDSVCLFQGPSYRTESDLDVCAEKIFETVSRILAKKSGSKQRSPPP